MHVQALDGDMMAGRTAGRAAAARPPLWGVRPGWPAWLLALVVLPLWLAMGLVALLLLGLMLALEPVARAGTLLRPGTARQGWRTGALF